MNKIIPFALLLSGCVIEGAPTVQIENRTPVVVIAEKQPETALPRGTVLIHSGSECVDVHGDNGRTVIRHACHGGSNQQWQPHADGTLRQNGKCLDIAGKEPQDGANAIVYACNGDSNQQWYAHRGEIRSRMHGKCLDASERYLKIRRCNGSAAQQFRF